MSHEIFSKYSAYATKYSVKKVPRGRFSQSVCSRKQFRYVEISGRGIATTNKHAIEFHSYNHDLNRRVFCCHLPRHHYRQHQKLTWPVSHPLSLTPLSPPSLLPLPLSLPSSSPLPLPSSASLSPSPSPPQHHHQHHCHRHHHHRSTIITIVTVTTTTAAPSLPPLSPSPSSPQHHHQHHYYRHRHHSTISTIVTVTTAPSAPLSPPLSPPQHHHQHHCHRHHHHRSIIITAPSAPDTVTFTTVPSAPDTGSGIAWHSLKLSIKPE